MSNPNTSLESVIEESIADSQVPDEPVSEPSAEVETPVEAAEETPTETEEVPDVASAEEAPAAEEKVEATAETQDDFERLAGMPAIGPLGRENRIPYSRVKKITEKAVTETIEAALGRKLNKGEKAADVIKAHIAQIPELTTKVTDYETRLDRVGEFENIMANDPERFLQMLSRIPAYNEFFTFVKQAYDAQQGGAPAATGAAQQAAASGVTNTETTDPADPMPEPNDALDDGTRVYNMEGLKGLMAWNSRETERRVNKQWEARYAELETRYRPIESEYRHRKHIESVLPTIQKQIAEAKTWALFDENEAEITAVLEADPNISLEGAYRKVVFPKLIAERNAVRRDVIKEVQKAPKATSVTGAPTKAAPTPSAGPRKLEDVIAEQIQTLK